MWTTQRFASLDRMHSMGFPHQHWMCVRMWDRARWNVLRVFGLARRVNSVGSLHVESSFRVAELICLYAMQTQPSSSLLFVTSLAWCGALGNGNGISRRLNWQPRQHDIHSTATISPLHTHTQTHTTPHPPCATTARQNQNQSDRPSHSHFILLVVVVVVDNDIALYPSGTEQVIYIIYTPRNNSAEVVFVMFYAVLWVRGAIHTYIAAEVQIYRFGGIFIRHSRPNRRKKQLCLRFK